MTGSSPTLLCVSISHGAIRRHADCSTATQHVPTTPTGRRYRRPVPCLHEGWSASGNVGYPRILGPSAEGEGYGCRGCYRDAPRGAAELGHSAQSWPAAGLASVAPDGPAGPPASTTRVGSGRTAQAAHGAVRRVSPRPHYRPEEHAVCSAQGLQPSCSLPGYTKNGRLRSSPDRPGNPQAVALATPPPHPAGIWSVGGANQPALLWCVARRCETGTTGCTRRAGGFP